MTLASSGFADRFARLLEVECDRLHARDILGLLSFVLGSRVQVGDASRYIYEHARRAGYDIPPYPLAGCGEIKEFFADEGVRNVPEWYCLKLGVDSDEYAALPSQTAVVVRDHGNRRKAFFLDGVRYVQDAGFANLEESGLARVLSENELVVVIDRIMAFLLNEGAEGTRPSAPSRGECIVRFESPVF